MSINIGIDLGTTNTVVCYYDEQDYVFLEFGNYDLLPSAVYIAEGNKIYVGSKALNMGNTDPTRLIRSSKIHMGDNGFVYPDSQAGLKFEKKLTPTDVACLILKEVKKTLIIEEICSEGDTINAVITVPAYFSTKQIEETTRAAKDAGLNVKSILAEPTAASIAYINDLIKKNTQIFVVDFGGGTLDLTLLIYDENNENKYVPLAIHGDNHLGGDDIDECVANWIYDNIKKDVNIDLRDYKSLNINKTDYLGITMKILNAAEVAKRKLSFADSYSVKIANLFMFPGKEVYDFEKRITVDEFNKYCDPVYKKFKNTIAQLFSEGRIGNSGKRIDVSAIDRVLLVGGSCNIPYIKRIVEEMLNKKTTPDDLSNIVAKGACISCMNAMKGEKQVQMIAYDLGIEIAKKDNIYETEFDPIIKRQSLTPCSITKSNYTTIVDDQKTICINVYERSGSISKNDNNIDKCDFYGGFIFTDFLTGKAGEPSINITFEFDNNRNLCVSVVDARTGSSITKSIKRSQKKIEIEHPKQGPTDIYLLIDCSGSMAGDRLRNVKNAVTALVTNIVDMNICRIGILAFNSDLHDISDLTNDASKIITKVKSISPGGGTMANQAFDKAYKKLSASDNSRQKAVIMLTDGKIFDEAATAQTAVKMRNANMRVITIGTADANMKYLKKISSSINNVSDTYPVNDLSNLAKTFRTIINTLKQG